MPVGIKPGRDKFREESLNAWAGLLKDLFPSGTPTSARWTGDLSSMSAILNQIASPPRTNHLFLPSGCGMDLLEAMPFDEEDGCLALRTGDKSFEVLKPSVLLFEAVGSEPDWAYFRLESEPLEPCGVYDDEEEADNEVEDENDGNLTESSRKRRKIEELVRKSEEVVLVAPGIYAPRSAWDANEYDGEPLPETTQLVSRYLSGDPFVIFAKGSLYNMGQYVNFDAYDPECANQPAGDFRKFIGKLSEL
jgi:hypothetical protein